MSCKDDTLHELAISETQNDEATKRTETTGSVNVTVTDNRIVFDDEAHFNAVNSYYN